MAGPGTGDIAGWSFLVTGGGSGIGLASASALAEAGWTVVVAGRRAEPLEAVARACQRVHPIVADVTDEASVNALFGESVRRFGRIDLLFNNAGLSAPATPIADVAAADFRRVLDANVTGAFLCARAAFRQMATQAPQGGRIINNGSIAAHVPRPHAVAYTVSKHAVTGLTRALSLEGRALGIACGQIDIGNAATDMTGRFTRGTLQADGNIAVEPVMDVAHVAASVVHMASLPLDANVQFMTVMATAMPFVGRG
jgi:NAD(P)-dependent dehydrogenase (short-subunit alcohol dehydrogenase family)